MKKTVISLLFLLIVVATLPFVAHASTTQEKEIINFVSQKDKVTKAQCVVYENNCVVAVKTEKFSTKTDYCQFKEKLVQELTEKYNFENVFVTRSPKAMHAMDDIAKMDGTEREQCIQKMIEFYLKGKPYPPMIQPR